MPVEVVHWNPSRPVIPGRIGRRIPWRRPVNNFGDLIGPLLVNRILADRGLDPTVDRNARLVSVGSIMKMTEPGDVVWGTGVNGKSLALGAAPLLDVRAVRGPLTRQLLSSAGTTVPEVYGDPGLLWSRFWPRESYFGDDPLSPVTVVPNLHDWRRDRHIEGVVNPRQHPSKVIAKIATSKFVCGSSLHGIVIAESFGIPARLISPGREPDFKYTDYYAGTGRKSFTAAGSLEEALEMGGEPAPAWDSQPLLDAFPFDLWDTH